MTLPVPALELITDFTACHEPVKRVSTAEDIPAWLASPAYARISSIIARLNTAVKGKKKSQGRSSDNRIINDVFETLAEVDKWIDDTPLRGGPQRFGNAAFRDWGQRLERNAAELHDVWLPVTHSGVAPELLHYFINAFGNFTRIDYGSGHELSFVGYLAVLRLTGLLTEQDEEAMVFNLFDRYLEVCRRLQAKFRLEPAGSKGVWGLEDHQFLNFLWGSSQLIDQQVIQPSDILNRSLVSANSSDYLYLSSIQHINTLKRGPFDEHSPVLHNIATTVPNWQKVNSGLIRMYQAEVLEKAPVVQHFYFGYILPWKAGNGDSDIEQSRRLADPEKEAGHSGTGIAGTAAPWSHRTVSQASVLYPSGATFSGSDSASRPTHNFFRSAAAQAASSISPLGSISNRPISLGRNTAQPLRDPMKE